MQAEPRKIRGGHIAVLSVALVAGALFAHGVADSQQSPAEGPQPEMAPVSGKLITDWVTGADRSSDSNFTDPTNKITPQRFNL